MVPQWHRRRQKVALDSQRARWELLQASAAQFTVSESFTLGWFNVLLRHLWPTVLEKEVADSAAKNIKVPLVSRVAASRSRARDEGTLRCSRCHDRRHSSAQCWR